MFLACSYRHHEFLNILLATPQNVWLIQVESFNITSYFWFDHFNIMYDSTSCWQHSVMHIISGRDLRFHRLSGSVPDTVTRYTIMLCEHTPRLVNLALYRLLTSCSQCSDMDGKGALYLQNSHMPHVHIIFVLSPLCIIECMPEIGMLVLTNTDALQFISMRTL